MTTFTTDDTSRGEGIARQDQEDEEVLLQGAHKVLSARGTEDGLVLRIDGKAEWAEVLAELELFLGGKRRFLEGGKVAIEWLDRLPTLEQSRDLEQVLRNEYRIEIVTRRRRPSHTFQSGQEEAEGGSIEQRVLVEEYDTPEQPQVPLRSEESRTTRRPVWLDEPASWDTPTSSRASRSDTLTNDLESLSREILSSRSGESPTRSNRRHQERWGRSPQPESLLEEDANAKIVFSTLRSGQRIETPFSLIIIGDVNPGADLIAGGDIIVFGALRGTAHASAYDYDAFDKVIIAFQMRPMQLRIGSIISRGSDEVVEAPEIARIENRRIIVEAFNARSSLPFGRRLR